MSFHPHHILGVRIDTFAHEDALRRAEELIEQDGSHYIVTPNPEIILRAQTNPAFRDVLNNAALSLCDGTGVYLAASLMGLAPSCRICGVDFMEELCATAHAKKWSVCLIGGEANARARTKQVLQERHPALVIYEAGENDNLPICNIAFVALGAPKQEFWIAEHIRNGAPVKLFMAVGGALDMLGGTFSRAPKIFRTCGLEWLWRLVLEPSRVGRIFNATLAFPVLFFISLLRK